MTKCRAGFATDLADFALTITSNFFISQSYKSNIINTG